MAAQASAESGRIADNIVAFVRTLRRVGLALGPADALHAIEAVLSVGIRRRDDVYWALRASLVRRAADADLFDETFRALWEGIAPAPQGISPAFGTHPRPPTISKRLAEALGALDNAEAGKQARTADTTVALAVSNLERLGTLDIAEMGVEEKREAEAEVHRLVRPLGKIRTRRFRTSNTGHDGINLPATLRAAVRTGGIPLRLVRQRRRTRPPTIVVLCDISGSMAPYTRMFLHFMHALSTGPHRVFSFVFGTRLTDITRALRIGDPDQAVQAAAAAAQDWSGGTRISTALRTFNKEWSRRVLPQGAVVLLMSDGLERDPASNLAKETARLQRSCRKLIWLNPLLRFAGFQPRASGIVAIRSHVDELRPVHSLDSMRVLADALAADPVRDAPGRKATP